MGAGSSSGSNRRRFNVPSLAGMGGRRLLVVLCLNIGDVSHIQATLRMRLVAAEPYSQSRRPRAMCASNSPPPKNDVQIQAASLLAVAKRIDAGASIAAVTKSYDSTLFKIDPSADAGAALTLATLSALRISFPLPRQPRSKTSPRGARSFIPTCIQTLKTLDTHKKRVAPNDPCGF